MSSNYVKVCVVPQIQLDKPIRVFEFVSGGLVDYKKLLRYVSQRVINSHHGMNFIDSNGIRDYVFIDKFGTRINIDVKKEDNIIELKYKKIV